MVWTFGEVLLFFGMIVVFVLGFLLTFVSSGEINEDLRSAMREVGFDIDDGANMGIEDALTDPEVGVQTLQDFASLTKEFFQAFVNNVALKLSIVAKSKLTRLWEAQQEARFPSPNVASSSSGGGRKKKRRRRSVDKDVCKAGKYLREELKTPEKTTLFEKAGSPKTTWNDLKDDGVVQTLAEQLTSGFEDAHPTQKLKRHKAIKAIQNFFAGSRQTQRTASSEEKQAEKEKANKNTDHRLMRARADDVMDTMVEDEQLTEDGRNAWKIAFQHSDTGKAGLLMTPSGDSKLFNREHKFEYFKGLANARVAELQEIIKGIGGYAVNRKSAIKRPVAEATDNAVIKTPNLKRFTSSQLEYLGVDPVVDSDSDDDVAGAPAAMTD